MQKVKDLPKDSLFSLITKTGESRALMFLDWRENIIHMRKQANPKASLSPINLMNTPENILSVNYFEHIMTFVTKDGKIFGFDLKKVPEPLDFEFPLFEQRLQLTPDGETPEQVSSSFNFFNLSCFFMSIYSDFLIN